MKDRSFVLIRPKRKWRDLTFLGVLSIFMIASNQNCAQPTNLTSGSATLGITGDNQPVTTIDDIKRTSVVTFAMKEVQLNSQLAEVALAGECSLEQQDAVLNWSVNKQGDTDSAPFASGQSVCDRGHFQVQLAPTQQLDCGQPYEVRAQLGAGPVGVSLLTRACPAGT